MSKARKFVKESYMNDLPEPTEGQFVSRILSNQSGSSFEIEIPAKEVTFSVEDNARSEDGFIKGVARLPAKFKNLIFVKRGSLVIVEPISHSFVGAGALSKNKITHEIVHILSEDHVRNLVKKQLFPECFVSESVRKMMDHASQVDEFNFLKNTHPLDDEDDDMIGLGNVNRRVMMESDSSEDEDDDDEGEDEDEDEDDEEQEQEQEN